MTIVRVGQRAEPIETIVQGLLDGSRTLSPVETANILAVMNEALETLRRENEGCSNV